MDCVFVASLVALLLTWKYSAAKLAAFLLRYDRRDADMMWSLSIPQVAATLAAALVAYQTFNSEGERLISEMTFDSVLVLMAVTTILGPILTERFAKRMPEYVGK